MPAAQVFKLPDTVSFEAGAGLLFNDLTVLFALTTRGQLTEGATVLVHSAPDAGTVLPPDSAAWYMLG